MPRPSIGKKPMTDAERQPSFACSVAHYRAARAAGAPVIQKCRPADHRSRAQRWNDTVAALVGLQAEYAAWPEALPVSLRDSATAEALQAIWHLDLDGSVA